MATATTTRDEMYLSVLAGRAVTALVGLAGNPAVWSQRIESGLRDGIVYCKALRAKQGRTLIEHLREGYDPVKRSMENNADITVSIDITAESEKIEHFLSQLASRERAADTRELVVLIEFLRKTATER